MTGVGDGDIEFPLVISAETGEGSQALAERLALLR